jgi:hypothetical protein
MTPSVCICGLVLLPRATRLPRIWLAAVRGMSERVIETGAPPEKVAVNSGTGTGEEPLSYWGALAPYFAAMGNTRALGLAREHLVALDSEPTSEATHTTTACPDCSARALWRSATVST